MGIPSTGPITKLVLSLMYAIQINLVRLLLILTAGTSFITIFDTRSDEFPKYDISTDSGKGPWYAPVHSNYGIGTFAVPPNPVYNISENTLTLSTINISGNWVCSTTQTMNSATCLLDNTKGEGFACQNCYFEYKAKLPRTQGAWSALWLHSLQFAADIMERMTHMANTTRFTFGQTPQMIAITQATFIILITQWYAVQKEEITSLSDNDWHLHGALLTNEYVVIYFDRKELARIRRAPENKVPHYIILMAMNNVTVLQESSLLVGYVNVYSNETESQRWWW